MKLPMFAILATLSLVAGCGAKEPEEATATLAKSGENTVVTTSSSGGTTTIVKSEDGTVTATTTKTGGLRAPSEFLPFAPAYPGATIKTRVASASSEEGSGSMIAMHTPDDFAKVVAFYDQKAKAAGVTVKMVADQDDSAIRILADEKSGTGALIAISPDTEKPGTVIVITTGSDAGARNAKDAAKAEAAKVAASNGGRLQ